MSKTVFRYGLWAATLFVIAWVTALVSALVGSKGIDKMKAIAVDGVMPGAPVGLDSGAGEVLSGD